MKKKIVGIVIIAMTMIISVIAGAVNVQIENEPFFENTTSYDENDAELPTWYVGNSWTYDITIDGNIGELVDMNNVKFQDLEFTVTSILDEYYELSMQGDITGSVTLNLEAISLSGSLQDTSLYGTVRANKTTLALENYTNVHVEGDIKPVIGTVHFEVDFVGEALYGIPPLNFPINVGNTWDVSEMIMTLDYTINALGQTFDAEFGIYFQEHSMSCEGWEVVNAANKNYETLKLSSDLGNKHEIYYAPGAGNVVKVVGDNIPLITYLGTGAIDIDVELQSTNFVPPGSSPEIPSTPSGPTTLLVGESADYTTSTTDYDGDIIKYVFDWGDGTKTTTDFYSSGEPVIESNHWTSKGNYNVRVKARDKNSLESDWSESLSVEILNDAPAKPDIPFGPEEGNYKDTHTYTTKSTDPDGHKIKYYWDWGDGQHSWTNLVNSGELAQASHKWSSKGDYVIKVKAVDEYNEESEWSDPLSVTMPRNKASNFNFDLLGWLFEQFPNAFPILRHMLGL